jgi:hypothetical protein
MAVKPNLPGNKSPMNEGQMKGDGMPEKFGNPTELMPDTNIPGMAGTHDDIGEKSGFQTEGYIFKKGTQYGEAAKLNYMPPGMDIDNQECADIRPMPMKQLTSESYPGDGWTPSPRNLSK